MPTPPGGDERQLQLQLLQQPLLTLRGQLRRRLQRPAAAGGLVWRGPRQPAAVDVGEHRQAGHD